MRRLLVAALLAFALMPVKASALLTGFLSLGEPSGWRCTLQAARWICTSPLVHERDGTTLVVTATDAPPAAGLGMLQEQLKVLTQEAQKKKRFPGAVVSPMRVITLDGVRWVDAKEKNVAGPGLEVRRLATLLPYDDKMLVVIVSYSVNEVSRAWVEPQLDRALASLRVSFWSSPRYHPKPGKMDKRCDGGDMVACFLRDQRAPLLVPLERKRVVAAAACALGADEACLTLSSLILSVPGSSAAEDKSLDASCERGTAEVCAMIGMVALEHKHTPIALPKLRKACEGGVPTACRAGLPYVTEEKEKKRWLDLSCRAGDGEVCFALANETKDEVARRNYNRGGCQGNYAASCLTLVERGESLVERSYLERSLTLLAADCDSGRKNACTTLEKLRSSLKH